MKSFRDAKLFVRIGIKPLFTAASGLSRRDAYWPGELASVSAYLPVQQASPSHAGGRGQSDLFIDTRGQELIIPTVVAANAQTIVRSDIALPDGLVLSEDEDKAKRFPLHESVGVAARLQRAASRPYYKTAKHLCR